MPGTWSVAATSDKYNSLYESMKQSLAGGPTRAILPLRCNGSRLFSLQRKGKIALVDVYKRQALPLLLKTWDYGTRIISLR